MADIVIRPIGVIHSPYTAKDDCPIQGIVAPDEIGRVELFPEFTDGLLDIELFSHLILLYQFDRAGEVKLVRPTFLDDAPHGVFASRHPCRPNGIGLSIVKLISRSANMLTVGEMDILDGAPLLDVKPFVPIFDARPGATNGWVSGKSMRAKPAGRE